MIKTLKINNPKKGFIGRVHIKINPPEETFLIFHRKGFYYFFKTKVIQVHLNEDKEIEQFKKEFPKEYESSLLQRTVREMVEKATQIAIAKSFFGIPYRITKIESAKKFNKIKKTFIGMLADPNTDSEI